MRAGLIGTVSDSSNDLYFVVQSLRSVAISLIQAWRLVALVLSIWPSMRTSTALASPKTLACSG